MEIYTVRQFQPQDITVSVPASKSILNRALLLSALSKGTVLLRCGDYADDTRALIDCLNRLGIQVTAHRDGLTVEGCGGNIPNRTATLPVRSAGTVARFLTAALAFCGGNYTFTSSDQMKRRPMELLYELEKAGIQIEYAEERGHFPFRMHSEGVFADSLEIDTDTSTQYASGILIAAMIKSVPFTLKLLGNRVQSSYISMTLAMLQAFHVPFRQCGCEITVYPQTNAPSVYDVEPDLSGACYFYALSLLCSCRVCVRNVKRNSLQGDSAFLSLLESRGVTFSDSKNGLVADGTKVSSFRGFTENLQNFSDQTLTVAALAPFASSPTLISGVSHIRLQESDRLQAIYENLSNLGVPVQLTDDGILIFPAPPHQARIKTYDDHRVAMAFSLIGFKIGGIEIENPSCTRKTFDGFFDRVTEITNN